MRHPDWFALLLLALAAYRLFRLIGEDTILDRPRAWLLRIPVDYKDGDPIPDAYREHLGLFLQCPWCAGFWITLGWWAAWWEWPHASLFAAAPLALSTIVGLTAKNLDLGPKPD
jgi:hypothetical protein